MNIKPTILHVNNLFNGLAVTFSEVILSAESDLNFYDPRGFPPGVELDSIDTSSGQLIITLSTTSPSDVEIPLTAGIVVKDLALTLESGGSLEFFIPLKQVAKICPDAGCTEDPPDYYTEYEYDFPVALQSVNCYNGKLYASFNVPINFTTVPSPSSFLLDDEEEITVVEIIDNQVILTTDKKAGLLSYLPPTENFLRTAETPFRIIAPWSRYVDCNAQEECDPVKPHANGIGIPADVRNGRSATIEDYIEAFTLQEAVQVSNLGNAGATEINIDRMMFALSQASEILNGYISVSTWAGRALLIGTRVRAELVIARYMLHSDRRPADVTKDYEMIMTWVDQAHRTNSSTPSECDQLDDKYGGRVVTDGIAQQYNVDNGLGLRGWALDPEDLEFRQRNGGYLPDWMKKYSV